MILQEQKMKENSFVEQEIKSNDLKEQKMKANGFAIIENEKKQFQDYGMVYYWSEKRRKI